MPTQVLRFEPRGTGRKPPAALVRHIAGESRPSSARPGRPCILLRISPTRAATELVAAALDARGKRPGRKPEAWTEAIFAGPPAFDSEDAWPPEKVEAWAKSSLQWLHRSAPRAIIHTASLHLDENSPHVHAIFSATSPDGQGGVVLGWKALRGQLAGRNGAPPRRGKAAGAKEMSAIQDSYHEAVGQHFGLARGERGSEAKHQAVDRQKSLDAREKAQALEAREQVLEQWEARLEARMLEEQQAESLAAARRHELAEREADFEGLCREREESARRAGYHEGREHGIKYGREFGRHEANIWWRELLESARAALGERAWSVIQKAMAWKRSGAFRNRPQGGYGVQKAPLAAAAAEHGNPVTAEPEDMPEEDEGRQAWERAEEEACEAEDEGPDPMEEEAGF